MWLDPSEFDFSGCEDSQPRPISGVTVWESLAQPRGQTLGWDNRRCCSVHILLHWETFLISLLITFFRLYKLHVLFKIGYKTFENKVDISSVPEETDLENVNSL